MEGNGGLALAVSARLTRQEGRKFGFTLGIAFLVLAALTWWRGHTNVASVFSVVGVLLLAAGLLIPTHLGPVERGWMKLGMAIGHVMTPVYMAFVYFVILTPVGFVMRVFGRNPLKQRQTGDSLWVPRGEKKRSDLQRQF